MTLIEVMLAVAILATLMALVAGTVASSFRFRRAALDKFDRYREVQQALERVTREVGSAFVTNVGETTVTNERREVTYATTFEGKDDELTFTSFSHVRTRAGEAAGDQTEITYRIESHEDDDGRQIRSLVRRSDAPIDDKPDRGGAKYVMLRDVESVRFEFWDGDQEIAGDAWVRSWDAINDHDGRLPARVRVTVEVKHPLQPRETLTFSTQAQIQLRDPVIILPTDIAAALADLAAQVGEICNDGVDNDQNGDTDCDDDACLEDPVCDS